MSAEMRITLRDVSGLDPRAEEETVTWAASRLVEAAIMEQARRG